MDLFNYKNYIIQYDDIPNINPVCRSCHCRDEWCECEYAGLCPHSYEDDDQFSFRCLNAFYGLKLGKYNTITEAAKCNDVSVRDFAKFRKVKGLKV